MSASMGRCGAVPIFDNLLTRLGVADQIDYHEALSTFSTA